MHEKKPHLESTFTLQNFSSTATLTENEGVKLGTKNEKDYNPFDNRQVEHPNTNLGSLVHLLKSSLGSGILAMPNAFKNSGLIFGAIGTLFVGFICTHCVHILVKCSHELSIRAKVPSMTFADTVGTAFKLGPVKLRKLERYSKIFVDIFLVTTHFSGICVYVVLIADAIYQLVPYYLPDVTWSVTTYMWILFVPLALLCQIRELKYLVPFSMFANFLLGASLVIILYYMFREIDDISDRNMFTSVPQLPMFFSTVLFAMEGIGVIMPLENNMKTPQHFLGCPGVLNIAMSIVVSLYAVVGFFGYLTYGENTAPNISMSLDIREIPAQIAKISIPLAIFFTYGLQFYVPIDIIWNKLIKHRAPVKFHNFLQILVRTLIVFLTIVVAVVVKDLEHLIGLVGSICLSILGIMVPAAIETVTYWEYDLGRFNWILIKNTCFFIMAIAALLAGSYVSILGIVEANRNYKP